MIKSINYIILKINKVENFNSKYYKYFRNLEIFFNLFKLVIMYNF